MVSDALYRRMQLGCQCGHVSRSMSEEARHRHNFPALCRRPKAKPVKPTPSLAGLKDFGAKLITTGDLDPIYVALVGADLDREQMKRWLLAYWMFYHAGFASYASERRGGDYWAVIERAAYNLTPSPRYVDGISDERWPRGTERRHFRGDKCVAAVKWFMRLHPETYVEALYEGILPTNHKTVIARATKWPQFGPWIAFKAADMLERCLGVPVSFSMEVSTLYKEPAKMLEILLAAGECGGDLETISNDLEEWAGQFAAPPWRSVGVDRVCSHQEIETVLCKYKSHIGGHYPIGKDTKELREGLEGWGETAKKLLAAAPAVV